MKGLYRKIVAGFSAIVLLLAFSGIISLFELGRLSRDAETIFNAGKRTSELAKEMFDAAQEQHEILFHMTVFGERAYEKACRESLDKLRAALVQARTEALDASYLDSLSTATTALVEEVERYLDRGVAPDSVLAAPSSQPDARWYSGEYERLYRRTTDAVKRYMTSTQGSLAPRTELLRTNAYRAVTPVFVSLLVTILIVLMLLYFITVYGVRPLVRINESLGEYLRFHLPFTVKGEVSDELLELKDKIDVLIAQNKKRGDEPPCGER